MGSSPREWGHDDGELGACAQMEMSRQPVQVTFEPVQVQQGLGSSWLPEGICSVYEIINEEKVECFDE